MKTNVTLTERISYIMKKNSVIWFFILFFIVVSPIQSIRLARADYEKINIIGETSNKGVFDPSVEYNEDGSVGYLMYSGLEQPAEDILNPFPKYIHTHLAKSADSGQTWTFEKIITESEFKRLI